MRDEEETKEKEETERRSKKKLHDESNVSKFSFLFVLSVETSYIRLRQHQKIKPEKKTVTIRRVGKGNGTFASRWSRVAQK